MKLLSLLIKIIPVLTLVTGIFSGGARLGPFGDAVKVALTQYEVGEITKIVINDINTNKGVIVTPAKFSAFVRDNFHSQYSVLAREIKGDRSHDQSLDIWGNPFQLTFLQDLNSVKVASPGPDGELMNKDDIGVDFEFDFGLARRPARKKIVQVEVAAAVEEVQEREPSSVDAPEQSEYDVEGFDREGFDREGFDRDGYDAQGLHRSERETQATDAAYQ